MEGVENKGQKNYQSEYQKGGTKSDNGEKQNKRKRLCNEVRTVRKRIRIGDLRRCVTENCGGGRTAYAVRKKRKKKDT
jgi:hypothetical protein